jgi:DNA-directed RNA polymerase specialized sigma24 family protein
MTRACFDECQELIFREVARQVQRLARRLKLQPADLDDAFQEIAFDAWRRLPGYQPCRGDLGSFVGVVTLNQARKIETRFHRRRACPDVSLDSPIVADCTDGELTLGDGLTQDDGLPALLGNVVDGCTRSELMLDLSRAIARLPSDMRRLCACLAHETPGIARRVCGLPNTGMYRRIEELRLHFRSFGLETS